MPVLVASLIPQRPEYPWQSVLNGLTLTGMTVVPVSRLGRDDVLVIWNRYGHQAQCAGRHPGRVLVMENGYTPPLVRCGVVEKFYALGFDGLQSKSRFLARGVERWASFGFKTKSWQRKLSGHILVCGQRGGAYSETSMPYEWPAKICKLLLAGRARQILYRPHPERPNIGVNLPDGVTVVDPSRPLATHLADAYACVVWGSNSVVEAVMMGVPSEAFGPGHILQDVLIQPKDRYDSSGYDPSGPICYDVQSILLRDRLPAFERLAWGQWTEAELKTGSPFKRLLDAEAGGRC